MAENSGFTIPGAAELAKGLAALGPKIANKIGDDALRAWSKPIIAEAKRLVARRTGGLARSITTRKAQRYGEYNVITRKIGFRRPSGSHAHFIEFGNSHQAAQPFMRPAMDTKGQEGADAMGHVLGTGIDREAEKLLKG